MGTPYCNVLVFVITGERVLMGERLNKFVCLFYKSDAQRNAILGQLEKHFRGEIPYPIGSVHQFDIPKRKLIIWSAEAKVSPLPIDPIHATDDCGVVFDGIPYTDDIDPSRHWAEQILSLMQQSRLSQFYDAVMGDYCVAHFNDQRFVAFGDFAGACPIFYFERDGVVGVSNRQRLLHRIMNEGGRIELDPTVLGWLISQEQIFGNQSPYKGVRLIEPGRGLKIENGKVSTFGFPSFYNHETHAGEITPDGVSEAVGALTDQFSALARLPFSRIVMDMTGGMDSRAVLALSMASGLIDKVDAIRTVGSDDTPDVEVARSLLETLSLPFKSSPPLGQSEYSADNCWNRLRASVSVFDGTITPRSAANPSPSPGACLSGSGGELYRPHIKSVRDLSLTTKEEAYKWVANYQLGFDPLGLLHRRIAKNHHSSLRRLIDRYEARGVPYDDMHYLIYVEHRMPWWAGYTLANSGGNRRLLPLVNRKVASILFSVDPLHKKTDRLHFEIMKAVDPRLVEHQFLNNMWDSRLAPHINGYDIPKAPHRVSRRDDFAAKGKGWLINFAQRETDDLIDYAFESTSIVRDVVDIGGIDRLRRFAKRGNPRIACTLASLVMMRMMEI